MIFGIIIQTVFNVKNFSGRINGGTSVDPLIEEKFMLSNCTSRIKSAEEENALSILNNLTSWCCLRHWGISKP